MSDFEASDFELPEVELWSLVPLELPVEPDMPVELPVAPEDPDVLVSLPWVDELPAAPDELPAAPEELPAAPEELLSDLEPDEEPLAPDAPELITSSFRTCRFSPEPLKLARTSCPSRRSETEPCCPSFRTSVLESTRSSWPEPEMVSLLPSNFSMVPESWFSLLLPALDDDIAVPVEESLFLLDAEVLDLSLLLLPVDAEAPDLSLLPVEADAPGSVLLLEPDIEPLLEEDDEVPCFMLPELLEVVPDGLAVLWSLGAVAELPCVLL